QTLELFRREIEPVQLSSPAVIVRDEQRTRVGIPVRRDLAGEIDRELLVAAGHRVEDERALQALPLVQDDEALISGDRRPARRVEPLAGTVPELGDAVPLEIEDAQSAVAAVAVLAVGDREEALVARDADHGRALRMRIDELRFRVVPDEVDRRAFVAPRPTHDLEGRGDRDARAVCRWELLEDRLGSAAAEELDAEVAELVALRVVEPVDALPGGIEARRDHVAGAGGAVGDLPVLVRRAVPRVNLELPAGVRDVDEAIGIVARPRGKRESRRAIAALPVGLGRGDRGDAQVIRVYGRGSRCLASSWSNELELGGVPSPGVVARDMGAADPAVDAEEVDSVGFAADRVLSGRCQPQLEACEVLAIAERRRRRKRCAVVGFDEPRISLPDC